MNIIPRIIRLRDAPRYLGMDKNRFNREVRPFLNEFRIGKQGIAFDRLDLDRWVDHYIQCNGRHGQHSGDQVWGAKKLPDSINGATFGMSIKESTACELQSLLAQAALTKRKNT